MAEPESKPGKKAFALRLDPAIHAAVERLAAAELRSVNAQIETLLREALAARRKGPAQPNLTGPAGSEASESPPSEA